MVYGYIPQNNFIKDLFYKIIGFPLFIRRLQYPFIHKAMNYSESDTVLDIGCGPGWMSLEAARCNVTEILGIDFQVDESHLFLEEKFDNLKFIKGDVYESIPSGKKFDKILISSVLQLVRDDEGLLVRCKELLSRNGSILLTVPVCYPAIEKFYKLKIIPNFLYSTFKLPNSYKNFLKKCSKKFNIEGREYYTEKEIFSLVSRCGLSIEHVEYTPSSLGSFVFQALLFTRILFNSKALTSKLDILFLPITYLEFLFPQKVGIEILILAKRTR